MEPGARMISCVVVGWRILILRNNQRVAQQDEMHHRWGRRLLFTMTVHLKYDRTVHLKYMLEEIFQSKLPSSTTTETLSINLNMRA